MAREFAEPRWPEREGNRGFTLVEVLTALVVMGVATGIFFSLFFSSVELGESSRNQRVAARLAEERLADVLTNPGRYEWPNFDEEEGGELEEQAGALRPVKLVGSEEADVERAEPPETMPTIPRADERERNLYRGFEWQVSARLPDEPAHYIEVVIKILWEQDGRARVFALTSCMPWPPTVGGT